MTQRPFSSGEKTPSPDVPAVPGASVPGTPPTSDGSTPQTSLAGDFLKNGHGWVAALASIAGVIVTVLIATGVITRGPGTDGSVTPGAPSSAVGAMSTASATASTDASASVRASASASRTARPATGKAVDVTAPDQLTAVFQTMGLPEAEPYAYETMTDDVSGITIELPVAWEEGEFSSWLPREGNTRLGPLVVRTTDLGTLYEGFDTPGIFLGASTHYVEMPDGETILDGEGARLHGYCPSGGSAAYEDDTYELGWYEVFVGCEDGTNVVMQMAAKARDGSHVIYLHMRMTSTADVEALVRALETYSVGDPAARSDPESG
jgi:hypothetical protein